jgi:dienelactone hydrolase
MLPNRLRGDEEGGPDLCIRTAVRDPPEHLRLARRQAVRRVNPTPGLGVEAHPTYGMEPASSDCDVADDVAAFLDFAIGHYEVDPSQVYLTGISCGAIGVWDYLAGYGDEVVAAAVPISGHAEWALEEAGCAPLAEVPVWAFHGDMDDTVAPVHIAGPMDQIRACEGADAVEMELTLYADADHITAITRTYDLSAGHDIYAWLLEHESN